MIRLRELRKEKGMTQEAFIDDYNRKFETNYTPQAVSMIELGKRIPETKALINFAKYFGVTLDYFMGLSNIRYEPSGYYRDPEVARIADEMKNNPTARILFDAVRDLDVESINDIKKFIEFQRAKKGL